MNKHLFFLVPFFLILNSCSLFDRGSSTGEPLLKYKKRYQLKDKAGEFLVERETGPLDKKRYATKYRVFNGQTGKVLEQSVVISTPGALGKKLSILRPLRSQYNVWFEKKKYFSETKINTTTKKMDVTMKSPESQWNGMERKSFPRGTGVFCYFSQVIECANMTGFLSKAIGKNAGKMTFHLIFDGYPYFQEQYLNVPRSLFANAILEYDGKNSQSERRFSLKVGGTTIFYFLNSRMELIKMFWPNQGMSMVELD